MESKGLYHITAVDEVTQWQVMGATQQISEAYLLPVLEGMLAQFPFRIQIFGVVVQKPLFPRIAWQDMPIRCVPQNG